MGRKRVGAKITTTKMLVSTVLGFLLVQAISTVANGVTIRPTEFEDLPEAHKAQVIQLLDEAMSNGDDPLDIIRLGMERIRGEKPQQSSRSFGDEEFQVDWNEEEPIEEVRHSRPPILAIEDGSTTVTPESTETTEEQTHFTDSSIEPSTTTEQPKEIEVDLEKIEDEIEEKPRMSEKQPKVNGKQPASKEERPKHEELADVEVESSGDEPEEKDEEPKKPASKVMEPKSLSMLPLVPMSKAPAKEQSTPEIEPPKEREEYPISTTKSTPMITTEAKEAETKSKELPANNQKSGEDNPSYEPETTPEVDEYNPVSPTVPQSANRSQAESMKGSDSKVPEPYEVPTEEQIDQLFTDDTNKDEPKMVHYQKSKKTTLKPDGADHEQQEVRTTTSIVPNKTSYNRQKSSYKSSYKNRGGQGPYVTRHKQYKQWYNRTQKQRKQFRNIQSTQNQRPMIPRYPAIPAMPPMPQMPAMNLIPYGYPVTASSWSNYYEPSYPSLSGYMSPTVYGGTYAGVPETGSKGKKRNGQGLTEKQVRRHAKRHANREAKRNAKRELRKQNRAAVAVAAEAASA